MLTVTQPASRVNDQHQDESPVVVMAPVLPTVPAFDMGVADAEFGMPFAPETYFLWWNDLLKYTEGFESVKGESEITRAFKLQHAAVTESGDEYDIGEHESRRPFLY